tara:strand:+ start:833 stop:1615 length:783 start_codon:yes stop_codon:yes gene_type:complete
MGQAVSTKVLDLAKRVIRKYSGEGKKGVPQTAIKKFAGKHGREAAVKGFGKARVERVIKVMDKKADTVKSARPKEDTRPGALSGQNNTPTSRKKTSRPMKKKDKKKLKASKDKSKESTILIKAMRSRPEEGTTSFTTVVGKGVGTKPKSTGKAKKAAQRKSNQREDYNDFEARLSGMAHQGGVPGTGKGPVLRTGSAFGSGDPLHGLTGTGQAQDFMHGSRDVRVDPDDFFDSIDKKHGGKIGASKVTSQQRGWGKARKR